MKLSAKHITLIALFAALLAVCSQIVVPLPFTPIPVNLGTFAGFMTGALLPPLSAGVSILVYVLLGCVGVPVFAKFGAGPGVLFGPTGGYIFGYLAAALVISFLLYRKKRPLWLEALILVLGLAACYAFGTAWYVILTHTPVWAALGACVFPFLPGDALKILLAVFLARRLRPHLPLVSP